ncbi:MAG: MFS transporter [Halobacteriaceae archaeon]
MSGRGGALSLAVHDREFLALAGTAFARSQAYSTVLIALALYADLFGTTGTVEGLFGTAFALVQLVIVLPLGRAVDVGNAKRYLLAGLGVNVLVFVGFVFVQNPAHVILVRMVQGVGASLLWVVGASVVGEISPEDERGRWLGSYNQVGAFSSLAGDAIGGTLLYVYGFTLTYAVVAAVTVVAAVLVWGYLRENPGGRKDPEAASGRETLRALLDRPMVRALVTFRMAFSVGKMAVIIFLPIYARTEFGVTALTIGAVLAGGKAAKALSQGYTGELTDRVDRTGLFVVVGAIGYALGTAAIPLAGTVRGFPPLDVPVVGAVAAPVAVLFGAYAVLGVADSVRLPASMTLFVSEGERFDSVASSMSLRSISWKVGQVVGPFGVGVVKDTVSVAAGFWVASAAIVVATGAFWVAYARMDGTATPSTAGAD